MSKRAIAYKVTVKEILGGSFHSSAGEFGPNYVEVGENKVSRANIVGTLVELKENRGKLDDGSGEIAVVAFADELKEFKEGDVVRLFGKAREYEGERNLIVEYAKNVDEDYLKLRALELKKRPGGLQIEESEV